MKYTEVLTMLEQTNLPVTYYQWDDGSPDLPYLVFYYPNSLNMSADDSVYQRIDALNIELYTQNKDFATEKVVEAILDANHIVWNKSEIYLNTEQMYEVLYETEIIIDDEN